MIPFYLLLAASVLFLGRRFTRAPWLSVLFVMGSAVVVVSGNVMQDVPDAALASASVAAFLVAAADYEYADAYRAFAASAAERLGQEPGRIWYTGHWNWHFYAEREGLRQLHEDGPFPTPGALLIWPEASNVGRVQASESMPRIRRLYTITFDATLPLRTVGTAANLDLADAERGQRPEIPFRVRRSVPVQRFHVMRLEPRPREQMR